MLPYNRQESSNNSLTTSYMSYLDFPASSRNSFLLQNQQINACYQEPKLNINADRTQQRSDGQRKIQTKQGLRDPRVRLSVEVAHKFFKLHDLLGFDKASATLDWLINESRVSIEQQLNVKFSDVDFGKTELKSDLIMERPEIDIRPKNVLKPKNERRNEARTRARERTMEKRRKLMLERNMENVDDQCLLTEDVSNELDVAHYFQDYLVRSDDDYMYSLHEQLNGNSFAVP